MDDLTMARVRAIQARIKTALHERPDEQARSAFSPYVPRGSTEVQTRLWTTPPKGTVDDLEEILDRFERLAATEDIPCLQHALTVVLTHHPTVAALGLQLPTLDERSPSKVWPGRRRV